MKNIVIAVLLSLVRPTFATDLQFDTVALPLHLHEAEQAPRISIHQSPFASVNSDAGWRFSAMSKPFQAPTDGSWRPHDINLTSLYGIVVSGDSKENDKDTFVTIDASKARQPEGYRFTVEQVIDAVTTCVKAMHPIRPRDEGALEITIVRSDPKPKMPK